MCKYANVQVCLSPSIQICKCVGQYKVLMCASSLVWARDLWRSALFSPFLQFSSGFYPLLSNSIPLKTKTKRKREGQRKTVTETRWQREKGGREKTWILRWCDYTSIKKSENNFQFIKLYVKVIAFEFEHLNVKL